MSFDRFLTLITPLSQILAQANVEENKLDVPALNGNLQLE